VIRKYIAFIFLFIVFSCSNIEFVLEKNQNTNILRGKTALLIDTSTEEKFTRKLYSFFGNSEEFEYILKTNFLEKKENRIVKTNQVAEKIEYTLEADYELFYKTSRCKIFNKTIVSKFSFTPKSAGYNFGSDRSFDNLYDNSIDQNINTFIESLKINKSCIK